MSEVKQEAVHPTAVVETGEGRVFVLGRRMNEFDRVVLLELDRNDRATLVETFVDVEGIAPAGEALLCSGSERVRLLNGTRWTVQDSDVGIHTIRVFGTDIVGVGRDGAVARWKQDRWAPLMKPMRNLHLTDVAKAHDGSWVVVGIKGAGKGGLGIVGEKGLTPIKSPALGELLNIAALPGPSQQLLATGKGGLALLGWTHGMKNVAGGKIDADLGNAVVWEDRVLVAGRTAGVLAFKGMFEAFSPAPAQALAVAAERLWRLDRNTGLSWWKAGQWQPVELRA